MTNDTTTTYDDDPEFIAAVASLGRAPDWDDLHGVAAMLIDGHAGDAGDREYWVSICTAAGTTCPDGDPTPLDLNTYLDRYVFSNFVDWTTAGIRANLNRGPVS